MKLFIWADPYHVAWGNPAFFAVAETVEQAREIAKRAKSYRYTQYGGEDVTKDCGIVLGEPIRVVDVPCGEFHEWSE